MHFCVFSYNRGHFLRNCIASIERCVNEPAITVFDDDSDDPETRVILDEIARRHEVRQAAADSKATHKCGGLYGNMQAALDSAAADNLLCLVQDDTQLVRPLDDTDLGNIHSFFANDSKAAFLQSAFLLAINRQRNESITTFNADRSCYYRARGKQSVGVHFSAVSICHTQRLHDAQWRFASRERDNDEQAAKLFGKMGFMRDPFVAWLPNVPAYRGKIKTIALKHAERRRKCGLYPIEILSEQANNAFRSRDAERALPIAEDYLTLSAGRSVEKPWTIYPLQGSSLLKLANRLELKLRGR